MHHLRGNAIPADPLSDFYKTGCGVACPRSRVSPQTLRLWL